MFGDVVRTIRSVTGDIVETSRWRDREEENFTSTLGGINLAIVNKDPVTYGHRVMNLPSMGEIADMIVPSDSEPEFKPTYIYQDEIALDKKEHKFEIGMTKVLAELNQEIISKSGVDNGLIDPHGMFLISDGAATYMRTYVEYDWKGQSIWEAIKNKDDETEVVLASVKSQKLSIDNSKLVKPQNSPPKFEGEFTNFTEDEIERMREATVFTTEIYFDDKLAYVPKFQMYFPFKYYKTQQDKNYEEKGSDKYPIVSNYRYRVLDRKKTYSTELQFDVKYGEYELTVTQIIDWLNLEEEKECA